MSRCFILPGLVAIDSINHILFQTCHSGILSSMLPQRQTILPKLPTCLKLALYYQCLNALHLSPTLRLIIIIFHYHLLPLSLHAGISHTYTKQQTKKSAYICLHIVTQKSNLFTVHMLTCLHTHALWPHGIASITS